MTQSTPCASLESLIRGGILFLLVATPLTFGTVHVWAYSAMEIIIFLLLALSMVTKLLQPELFPSRRIPSFLLVPMGLFVALVLFQLVPMPAAVLEYVSPHTAALYGQARDGIFSSSNPVSLNPAATRLELQLILACVAMLFLVFTHFRERRDIKKLVVTLIVVGSFMSLLGLLQFYSGTKKIYWLRDASYASPFGPYINRDDFAGYMAMLIPLAVGYFLAGGASRWARLKEARKRKRLFRDLVANPDMNLGVLFLFALLMMTGALFVSLSRGGVASFLGAMVFLAVLLSSRRLGTGWGRGLLALGTLMALAVIWLGIDPLVARFAPLVNPQELVLREERVRLFPLLLQMGILFPVLGVGLTAFASVFPLYQTAAIRSHYLQAHSDWLQLLTDTGTVGLALALLFVGAFGVFVIRRWRTRRDPFVRMAGAGALAGILAIILHSAVDFNLQIPANALLVSTLLALSLSIVQLDGQPLRHRLRRKSRESGREVPIPNASSGMRGGES